MQSDQTNELATALAKAQGEMKAAIFNRINPHFKNRYADLAAILEAVRGPLSKNGLSITQTIAPYNENGLYLHTMLRHSSGQWVQSIYPLPVGGRPQEFGSALTYARRYSLSSIVGIAAEDDDDANAAQNGKPKVASVPAKPTTQAEPRDNPHVTTAADIIGEPIEYDQDGNPIDNIPVGDPGIERLSKAMARPEYANLLADIRNTKTLHYLKEWGDKNANRVASLPLDWQETLRGEFRDKMLELGWKPKAA